MNAYRRMLGKISSALLLAGAFVVVSAARADAALIVYICDQDDCGGAVTQIIDNGAGDTNPNVGRINASFAGGTIETLATSADAPLSSLSLNYDINTASVILVDRKGAYFATIAYQEDQATALAKIRRLINEG